MRKIGMLLTAEPLSTNQGEHSPMLIRGMGSGTALVGSGLLVTVGCASGQISIPRVFANRKGNRG